MKWLEQHVAREEYLLRCQEGTLPSLTHVSDSGYHTDGEGASVGRFVGRLLGFAVVGGDVGDADGRAVGFAVVGPELGPAVVGEAVGDWEGLAMG